MAIRIATKNIYELGWWSGTGRFKILKNVAAASGPKAVAAAERKWKPVKKTIPLGGGAKVSTGRIHIRRVVGAGQPIPKGMKIHLRA